MCNVGQITGQLTAGFMSVKCMLCDVLFFCHKMAEQMRKNDRAIRKTQRDVERERSDLERQEKKLVSNNSPFCQLCCQSVVRTYSI